MVSGLMLFKAYTYLLNLITDDVMKRNLLVLMSAAALSTQAMAIPEGYYGAGFGEINITDHDKDSQGRYDFIDDGDGFGLELGYFYGPRWGGRIEWSNLNFDTDQNGSSTSGDRYGIDALYRLQDAGAFYAIMGLKHLEAGKGHTALNLGLGADGMITDRWSAFAEGTVYGGVDEAFADFGAKVGVRYHFSPQKVAQDEQPVASMAPAEPAVAADQDRDGVIDDNDLCPDSAPEFMVDANGCVVLESVPVTIKLDVLFASNSAAVDATYHDEIASVAEFMKKHPEGKVEISGHTSAKGDADYNMALSTRRAKAVADVLVQEFGVNADRVSYQGYGESQLLDTADTEEAARMNRRIEAVFSVTEQREKRR